jgi:hypothetical protein
MTIMQAQDHNKELRWHVALSYLVTSFVFYDALMLQITASLRVNSR